MSKHAEFLKWCARAEAVASSIVERLAVRLEPSVSGGITGGRKPDVTSTQNLARMVQEYGWGKGHWSTRHVTENHYLLFEGVGPSANHGYETGEYREVDVFVRLRDGSNKLFVPHAEIWDRMGDEIRRQYDEGSGWDVWGRQHYRFENIHPFADGNGRVGRLLMIRRLQPGIVISDLVLENQQSYYDSLASEEQSAKWWSAMGQKAIDRLARREQEFTVPVTRDSLADMFGRNLV